MAKFKIIEKTGDSYTIGIRCTPINVILLSLVKLMRTYKILRVLFFLLGIAFLAGSVAYYYYVKYQLLIYVALGFTGIGLLTLFALSSDMFNIVLELDLTANAEKEREEAETVYEQDTKDPFSFLDVDTKRLNEYYLINMNQSKSSFNWAVFAMLVGLSTIVSGIWFFYLSKDVKERNDLLASLTTVAGVIVNVISGLYIYLHNKSQKRSLIYFNQLVRNQQLGLSIRLAESITDETKKTNAINGIISELLAIVKLQTNQDLNRILNEAESEEIKPRSNKNHS